MQPDPIVLAFDTSAAHCAAALVQGDTILTTVREDMAKGQAERLFPLLEEALASANLDWTALSAIGVCTGPGNFTGIRISVSSARGLALSLGIPAIGVSLLDALAFDQTGKSISLVDARRNRVFCQTFENGTSTGMPSQIASEDVEKDTQLIAAAPLDGISKVSPPRVPPVVAIAHLAARRIGQDNPRPAPLYLRPADAALPSDPPPVILP